ncbi:hypothetical protein P3T76_007692 [Phytophthora citrophthora]|uniref:Uncharacterized protein n=1 Tax=Phytophthora citrophthora TaxID=4793 RepID=A0AAD9LM42_9STRA|nr:hypothetical protein P3T76_007692 [Phytophthora citrophthora]
MATFLNDDIYRQIRDQLGTGVEMAKAVVVDADVMKLFCDATKLQDEKTKRSITAFMVKAILFDYPIVKERTDASSIAATAVNNLITQLQSIESPPRAQTTTEVDQLKYAFTKTEYLGDAHVKFGQYLRRCYSVYANTPNKFKAPYVAVAQSSGFGKSRMIRELAVNAMTDKDMRVLYMCMRPQNSTGYPKATTSLCQWLFPDEAEESEIAKRLQAIFYYATKHWDTVQSQWLEVFTDTMAVADVAKALEKTREHQEVKKASNPDHKPSTSKRNRQVVVVIDEARNLFNNPWSGLDRFRLLRHALVTANVGIGDKGQIFGVLVDTNSRIADLSPPAAFDPSSRRKDDTGSFMLFPPFVLTHTMDANWLQYCRDQREEVDTDAWSADEEDEEKQEEDSAMEDPNVEMENRVTMSEQVAVYKRVVLGNEDEAWNALKCMGRPMWTNLPSEQDPVKNRSSLITFAANKLMLGVSPWLERNYKAETMYGVASMLCRLGVRPYLKSALASRVVADFMATLAYVNYERDGYLCSYASDPVLTYGAMKVWYALDNGLSKFILPQLKQLILDETLDTGEIGEMVARILLLLAMDRCAMSSPGNLDDRLIGQLVSVNAFLKELGVEGMDAYIKSGKTHDSSAKEAFEEWKKKWNGWYMGYTHFVQLTGEPSEDTLWYLLGRRAAGVFPRGQDGADLLLPMVKRKSDAESDSSEESDGETTEEKVSLMLVQVGSYSQDSAVPLSKTEVLASWIVFEAGHSLSKIAVNDVIRICMDIGEEASGVSRFIVATQFGEKLSNIDSNSSVSTTVIGSGCSDGASWSDYDSDNMSKRKRSLSGAHDVKTTSQMEMVFTTCFRLIDCTSFPFLDEDVAASLASLVECSWPVTALVDDDLDRRDAILADIMPRADLHETVLKGLVNAPGRGQMTAKKRAVGRQTEESRTDRGKPMKIKRPQRNRIGCSQSKG